MLHYPNQDDPKGPPNVAATSAAITSALAPGPYYWNVVPVDAEGNRGVATADLSVLVALELGERGHDDRSQPDA